MCNRDALVGACTNLVNNSLEAGATRVSLQTLVDAGELVVRVIDNGPGFAPEDSDRLMEAFYTTKSHGTGLGLAVVQAVIKAHQGRFSIESPEQGGAVATLRLPLLRNRD
jgi:two-component system sensor histidine kinase FlrB